jgi:hypothetical protein
VLDEHRRITRYDGAVRNLAEFIDNANVVSFTEMSRPT